jgi:hypothetical protein
VGAGWWYKPEYIINELNINSVITTPCHDEILPINSWTTQRPYTLKGYSYSGEFHLYFSFIIYFFGYFFVYIKADD